MKRVSVKELNIDDEVLIGCGNSIVKIKITRITERAIHHRIWQGTDYSTWTTYVHKSSSCMNSIYRAV